MRVTKNAWDSNIIQSNGKYLSVNWDASGGGAFAIIPLTEVGKAPDQVPLFRGHKGPVLDTAFDPFDQQRVASCSDDGKISIWEIPEQYSFHKYVDENDEIKDIVEPLITLSGHTKKVGKILYHPCARNVLASSSLDYTVKIWNVETGKDLITLQHKDLVTSFAFNYNGSLLATTSRDKKLRIWDIRSGKIISEGAGHTGAKPSRVVWLGNTDRILTTGFSRLSDRQVGIWNVKDIEAGPIAGFLVIDSSLGVLIPQFDDSTSILYLAGKGDGNIRYYEYEYDTDELYEISQYASTDPQRGFAAAPKHSVNVKENEILKSFKTVNDSYIEPISFFVPRRSELFQADIYPDCPSTEAALSAEEWFGGKDSNGPLLMSLEAIYDGVEPDIREADQPKTKAEAPVADAKPKVDLTPKSPYVAPKSVEPASKLELPKPVDELLKSSDLVNAMLDKVNESSDNEQGEGDDWEEVKKPSLSEELKAESKAVGKTETKTELKQSPKEPESKSKETSQVTSFQAEPIKAEPKEEVPAKSSGSTEKVKPESAKALSPAPQSLAPAASTAAASSPSKIVGAPTLKNMVERLHSLIEKLEGQVSTLTEAGLEKDERLKSLEVKIESLLKK